MMKKVQSTVKPEAIEIDEFSAWIAENIQEVTQIDEEGKEHIGYEYELTQLSKDEYIEGIANENNQLKMQTKAQDMVVQDLMFEILPMIGGQGGEK